MINCPKCGADNLLNAVFCRTCGEKLDLNELKPDFTALSKDEEADAKKKRMNQIVGIVFSTVVIVLALVVLVPPAEKLTPADPSPEVLQKFEEAKCVRKVVAKKDSKGKAGASRKKTAAGKKKSEKKDAEEPIPDKVIKFTSQEATDVICKKYGLTGEAKGTKMFIPVGMTVAFRENGDVRLILVAKYYALVPVHFVVDWTPSVSGKGDVSFEEHGYRLGWLPLPGGAAGFISEQFKQLSLKPGNSEVQQVKAHVKGVKIADGEMELSVQ